MPRFTTRSFLNASISAQSFSAQNSAPLFMNPSNVTNDVAFVDASWHMQNSPRKTRGGFLKKRLHHARFLDIEEVAKEHELSLKMIPDLEVSANYVVSVTNTLRFSPRVLLPFARD